MYSYVQISIKYMLNLKVTNNLCMHITLLRTMVHNNSYVYLYVCTYVATFWQIMNLLHDSLQ